MTTNLKVVYTAGSLEEAYLLRNELEKRGIRAIVTNAELQGGATLGLWGREWMCLPRVAVDEEHAPSARRIAAEFDRSHRARAAEGDRPSGEPAAGEGVPIAPRWKNLSASWPRCPRCGAPRITRCPACGTSGTGFPPADTVEDEPPDAAASLVLCIQCDEPFTAEYAGDCEWCGHAFPDGFRPARPPKPERLPPALILMAALAFAIVIGLIAYFAILLSRQGS
jgi:hypothetical protein